MDETRPARPAVGDQTRLDSPQTGGAIHSVRRGQTREGSLYRYNKHYILSFSSNRFVSFSVAERWSLATRGTRERREQRERRGGGAWPRGLVTISSASTGSPDTGTVRSPHQASPVWTEGKLDLRSLKFRSVFFCILLIDNDDLNNILSLTTSYIVQKY